MIERYNREVKAGIRRMCEICPKALWYEVLHDVVRALRILPTTTTGFSPFQLTYKQEPALPVPMTVEVLRSDPPEGLSSAIDDDPHTHLRQHFMQLDRFWDRLQVEVNERLKK